jgi:hypothetical protein
MDLSPSHRRASTLVAIGLATALLVWLVLTRGPEVPLSERMPILTRGLMAAGFLLPLIFRKHTGPAAIGLSAIVGVAVGSLFGFAGVGDGWFYALLLVMGALVLPLVYGVVAAGALLWVVGRMVR